MIRARVRQGFGVQAFAADTENRIASLALGGVMLFPLAEIVSRKFLGATIPGSSAYASVLTLWLGRDEEHQHRAFSHVHRLASDWQEHADLV